MSSRERSDPPPDRWRVEPLPSSKPKPLSEDPQALEAVEALLSSPAYVRADQDPAFLERDDLRGVRLQLEYSKTEASLTEAGIRSTIVLFGGTRVVEPLAAEDRVREIAAALSSDPGNPRLADALRVAERVREKSKYYDVARDFGRLATERAPPGEFVIMTGGGPGIMEAGNRGAHEVGGPTIGLNITLPDEQYPNPYLTPSLCLRFRYFALRKLHFMKRAKALVAFAGGYGTLDELFDALCLVQTRKIDPIPIVLVGESFWRRAFDAEFLRDEGVIAEEDVQLFSYTETAEGIWQVIADWYCGAL